MCMERQMRVLQNFAKELGKKRKQMKKFKVGDKVRSPALGVGVVIEVNDSELPYPILVKWEDASYAYASYFTLEGHYCRNCVNPLKDIELLEGEDTIDLLVDRMMDALDKKTDDAINPSHYRVEGIPEAIDIMAHLMTKEQLEGFLWGNILKYAYRYGRKGDKKETAGKIAWYAKKLEDVGA